MSLKTMILIILDRSGSMAGRESDVIGGVNTFLDEQKKLPEPATLAMVRFDDRAIERFIAMQPLTEIRPITGTDFQPRGNTPLLDAVGQTIAQMEEDWKREQPQRAIVMIVTDGAENASGEYTKAKVQSMIKAREASGLWAFIYLGANVDAFAEAGNLGIRSVNTAGYTASAAGMGAMYRTISETVGKMRASGSTVAHNLGGNIDEQGKVHVDPLTHANGPVGYQSSQWTPPPAAPMPQEPLQWTPPQTEPKVWTPPPAA